jgi:hypothetical protein
LGARADAELRSLNAAAFDESGVDLTQIDLMLSLTPRERLVMLYESASSLARLMGDGTGNAESHLQSTGHKLLMTKFGVVDVLASLGELEYEHLLPDSPALAIQDMQVRVLSLERLIDVKQKAGREKDLAVLPLLRATLARSQMSRS